MHSVLGSRAARALILAAAAVWAVSSAASAETPALRASVDVQGLTPANLPGTLDNNEITTAPPPAPSPELAPAWQHILAEHECLSEIMYYEAGGAGAGGKAVAEVVYNRIKDGHFGSSICAIEHQGQGTRACQFSFVCNGALARPRNPAQWRQAEHLAAMIIGGIEKLENITRGAIGFHAARARVNFGTAMVRTVEIGGNVFYRRAGTLGI